MARYYQYQGKKLPSVTTITGQLDKPALVHWAANCTIDYIHSQLGPDMSYRYDDIIPIIESARKNFRKVSAQALDIGSAVHKAIEHYLKTGQEPQAPSDEVMSAFLAFLEWLDSWDSWETVDTEYTVYHDRYAGTLDWVVDLTLEGVITRFIIDFKSSKGIYPEYKYQIAAYGNAYYRQKGAWEEPQWGVGILRLDKETGFPEWEDTSDTYKNDLEVFNALVELWYARNPKHR